MVAIPRVVATAPLRTFCPHCYQQKEVESTPPRGLRFPPLFCADDPRNGWRCRWRLHVAGFSTSRRGSDETAAARAPSKIVVARQRVDSAIRSRHRGGFVSLHPGDCRASFFFRLFSSNQMKVDIIRRDSGSPPAGWATKIPLFGFHCAARMCSRDPMEQSFGTGRVVRRGAHWSAQAIRAHNNRGYRSAARRGRLA